MARINFADVPEQKDFDVLPQGQYAAQISNVSNREVAQGDNEGARIIRWEFEIIGNEKYNNRKVWDNQICIENSLWKVKALLNALELETDSLTYDDEEKEFYFTNSEGEEEKLDVEDLVGSTVEIKVGIRPARRDPNTNKEYEKQNRVNAFYPHEVSDAELMA